MMGLITRLRELEHPRGALWVVLCLICTCLCQTPQVEAHGVHLTLQQGQASWVQGRYTDDELMSLVNVKVINPQGKTHQVGNADASGRFAFLADEAGVWRVVFDDGMGHRVELPVDVSAQPQSLPSPVAQESPKESKPSVNKAVLGLSILFFLFGSLFWWKGKRK